MNTNPQDLYYYPQPAVTVAMVVFTIQGQHLKLLLVQRVGGPKGPAWDLPCGFVQPPEGLDAAARRGLEEETGARDVYLEQLYTFDRPGGDPRTPMITVAYYALIPSDKVELKAATGAAAVGWFSLDELTELDFDHTDIVTRAHERLSAKLDYSTIAFQFMPEKFTLSELQEVYETILCERMDKRNFRKWVLALERIEEAKEERRDGQHRPARLYRVKHPRKVEIIK